MNEPLRPNVTPHNEPIIRVGPLLTAAVLSIPWWLGVWHIVLWIIQ